MGTYEEETNGAQGQMEGAAGTVLHTLGLTTGITAAVWESTELTIQTRQKTLLSPAPA